MRFTSQHLIQSSGAEESTCSTPGWKTGFFCQLLENLWKWKVGGQLTLWNVNLILSQFYWNAVKMFRKYIKHLPKYHFLSLCTWPKTIFHTVLSLPITHDTHVFKTCNVLWPSTMAMLCKKNAENCLGLLKLSMLINLMHGKNGQ